MDIDRLSLEQLLELNRRIVHRVEYLQRLKTQAHLDRFDLGDRVSFQSEGRQVEGLVIRVNQKTVSIKTKEGIWRIHPRFLTKMPGPKSEMPSSVREIIDVEGEP